LNYDPQHWLPDADIGYNEQNHFTYRYRQFLNIQYEENLSDLISLDFTENEETLMVMTFKRQMLHIRFRCDSARQMWRKELKRYLATRPNWSATILPDMNDALRLTAKFL